MRTVSRRLPAIICFCLSCLIALTACSNLHKVVYKNDEYVDETTNSVYTVLPNCYEPISREDEYASLNLSGMKETLYTISGLDPAKWLTTEYNDVYCEKGTTLPDFAHWNTNELYICTNTKVSIAEVALRDATDVQAALIEAICREISEGQVVSYAAVNCLDMKNTMILRFASPDVPGLYYSMMYIETAESAYEGLPDETGKIVDTDMGTYFVYDRPNGRCVAVSNIIHYLLDSGIPTATVAPEAGE